MFITKEEFETHIYAEAMNVVSRGDDASIEAALLLGTQIVAKYLSLYNTDAIFSTTGTAREPYAEIILYIKDIAKWHFIAVSNVQVDLALAERRYELAIKELTSISTGKTLLPNYPLATDNQAPAPFKSGSNPKFNNYHY